MRLPTLLAALLCATPLPAAAAIGELRVGLAGATAVLLPPLEAETWGFGVGVSASVGLGEQLHLEAVMDLQRFGRRQPALSVIAWGAALDYDLDVGGATPTVALGLARVTVTPASGGAPAAELVPLLGLGIDVPILPWLHAGGVVHYYPLFDSELLGRPAYTILQARVTLVWAPPKTAGPGSAR